MGPGISRTCLPFQGPLNWFFSRLIVLPFCGPEQVDTSLLGARQLSLGLLEAPLPQTSFNALVVHCFAQQGYLPYEAIFPLPSLRHCKELGLCIMQFLVGMRQGQIRDAGWKADGSIAANTNSPPGMHPVWHHVCEWKEGVAHGPKPLLWG